MSTSCSAVDSGKSGAKNVSLEAASVLKQVLETTTRGIVAIRTDFRISLVNRVFLNYFGRNETEVLGAICYEIIPGEHCNTDACHMKHILAGERCRQSDVCKQDNNGCEIYFRITTTPLCNADGEIIGMVQEYKDLEEVRLFEQNLEIKSRRLEVQEAMLKDREITLRQVMHQVASEKREAENKIAESIQRIVVPLVQKARVTAEGDLKTRLELVETSLAELVSPLINSEDRRIASLTPRELEICHLIRQGLQSKEIACLLNTAEGTVEQQRKKIRRKLNLKGSSRNLASYLQTR